MAGGTSPVGEAPRIVGRYALYGEIGSGGMASVRFGKLLGPVGFSRPVAIKCLHPQHARDPAFRAMFLDEALLASRVAHPNVVATLDVVSTDAEMLLVMEYVAGESLARLRRAAQEQHQAIPLRVALAIVVNVLSGLHAAHEAVAEDGRPLEIVHRDVSPSNVLVGTDGVARVLDFGIARAAVRAWAARDGHVEGKLSYMAPEQLGGGATTRRADVYSASVLLWELLTARRLFTAEELHEAVVDKLLRGPVLPPSVHCPGLSQAIDAVTRRGLERDPARRFATAREMALALELASAGEVASPAEVARWVHRTGHVALIERAANVTRWESLPIVVHGTPPAVVPIQTPKAFATSVTRTSRTTLPDLPPRARGGPWHMHLPPARLAWPLAAALLLGSAWLNVDSGQDFLVSMFSSKALSSVQASAGPYGDRARGDCPAGMVHVSGGAFTMGDDGGFPDERPAHTVTLAPYCLDQHEVTVASFAACVARGGCPVAPPRNEGPALSDHERRALDPLCNAHDPVARASHPMNCVDWSMASAYCRAVGARLPTEAEWEHAARGPEGSRYPWGNDDPGPDRLNACGKECSDWGRRNRLELGAMYPHEDGWAATSPVGSFREGRSRFGVDDAAGNVAEWVADRFGPYEGQPQTNPRGHVDGAERVVRGGAWSTGFASWVRATFRDRATVETRGHSIGFRCAR
jgi:formylglycine-generating enzyme required for sulfatase activity/serine/threonine protein kinase